MTEEELMMMEVLNCHRVDLYTGRVDINEDQQAALAAMKERRINGEPLQYILGYTDFLDARITLNEHVLIPRPETELLAQQAINYLKKLNTSEPNVLDLGCGSGNISVAVAKQVDNCYVTSIDISDKCIKLTGHNALINGVAGRIECVCEDMEVFLKRKSAEGKKYDIVVSNPPYIPTAKLAMLPAEVRREPKAALDGAEDGLKFTRKIIANVVNVLKPHGALMMEIGEDQAQAVKEIMGQYPRYQDIEVLKDLNGRNRIVQSKTANL